MIYVANAFSLGMIAPEHLPRVRMVATVRPALAGLEWNSCVGHADTAAVLGVPMARVTVRMAPGDTMFVAQLIGPRLPEGSTVLPPGSSFEWVKVTL